MNEILKLKQKLPDRISRLAEVAYDLWWSSSEDARSLFRAISRPYWWMSDHNPIRLIYEVSSQRLEALAIEGNFLAKYDSLIAHYDAELAKQSRFTQTYHPEVRQKTVAYFSAEYGIHSSLPIY